MDRSRALPYLPEAVLDGFGGYRVRLVSGLYERIAQSQEARQRRGVGAARPVRVLRGVDGTFDPLEPLPVVE